MSYNTNELKTKKLNVRYSSFCTISNHYLNSGKFCDIDHLTPLYKKSHSPLPISSIGAVVDLL